MLSRNKRYIVYKKKISKSKYSEISKKRKLLTELQGFSKDYAISCSKKIICRFSLFTSDPSRIFICILISPIIGVGKFWSDSCFYKIGPELKISGFLFSGPDWIEYKKRIRSIGSII